MDKQNRINLIHSLITNISSTNSGHTALYQTSQCAMQESTITRYIWSKLEDIRQSVYERFYFIDKEEIEDALEALDELDIDLELLYTSNSLSAIDATDMSRRIKHNSRFVQILQFIHLLTSGEVELDDGWYCWKDSYYLPSKLLGVLIIDALIETHKILEEQLNSSKHDEAQLMVMMCYFSDTYAQADKALDLYELIDAERKSNEEILKLKNYLKKGQRACIYDESIKHFHPYMKTYWAKEMKTGGYITRIWAMAELLRRLIKEFPSSFPLKNKEPNVERIKKRLKKDWEIDVPEEAMRKGRFSEEERDEAEVTLQKRLQEIIYDIESRASWAAQKKVK